MIPTHSSSTLNMKTAYTCRSRLILFIHKTHIEVGTFFLYLEVQLIIISSVSPTSSYHYIKWSIHYELVVGMGIHYVYLVECPWG